MQILALKNKRFTDGVLMKYSIFCSCCIVVAVAWEVHKSSSFLSQCLYSEAWALWTLRSTFNNYLLKNISGYIFHKLIQWPNPMGALNFYPRFSVSVAEHALLCSMAGQLSQVATVSCQWQPLNPDGTGARQWYRSGDEHRRDWYE